MNEPVRRLPLPQQDRARGFAEALSTARGKHLLIALRGHPDPDGIASALAQAHIAQRLGVGKTTIGYCHELSHRENRALVKLLNVELKKMKNVADIEKVDFLGLVDAHDVDPDLAGADGIEVLTIVDHHRAHVPPRAKFVDMRNDVGATATIFVEYLTELFPLSVDQDDDQLLPRAQPSREPRPGEAAQCGDAEDEERRRPGRAGRLRRPRRRA